MDLRIRLFKREYICLFIRSLVSNTFVGIFCDLFGNGCSFFFVKNIPICTCLTNNQVFVFLTYEEEIITSNSVLQPKNFYPSNIFILYLNVIYNLCS